MDLVIHGLRTTITFEAQMEAYLLDICTREGLTKNEIATELSDRLPRNSSLSSALRVFIVSYYRAAATENGHGQVNHGKGGLFSGTPWEFEEPVPGQRLPATTIPRTRGKRLALRFERGAPSTREAPSD